MKIKPSTRVLAAVMALVMVLLMVPFSPMQINAVANTYTLDTSTDLTAFAAGAKADGETEVVNGYFTIHYTAKTKVDGSEKNFSDGYSATQRLNFQSTKCTVEFTTQNPATVKLWWVTGGAGRGFALVDANGQKVAETAVGTASNELVISELSLAAAGTYNLTVVEGSNYLFKMEVTETSESGSEAPVTTTVPAETTEAPATTEAPVVTTEAPATTEAPSSGTSGTYIFDATALASEAADKAEMSTTDTYGTNGYFTAVGSVLKRTKTDGSIKAVDTEKPSKGVNGIQFTVTGTAKVTVVCSNNGGTNLSPLGLLKSPYTNSIENVIANKEGITQTTDSNKITLTYENLAAGTYVFTGPATGESDPDSKRGVRIYTITVEETADSGTTPPAPTTPAPTTPAPTTPAPTTPAPTTPAPTTPAPTTPAPTTPAPTTPAPTTPAPTTPAPTTPAPTTPGSGEDDTPIVPTTGTYVLDTTTDLTAFAQGAKADGDTEVIKDFFTINYSSKNKVDGSDKEFEDGYTATQRLNFGGKTDGLLNTVEFATGAAATVKLWWVSGGDGRTMAIYDSTGAVIKATDATASVKNALYIDTFELAEAGTYYIGVPEGSNYLFKVEVTLVASEPEAPAAPTTGTYVLDTTTDLTAFAQGAKADGDTEVIKDFFTINYSAKNKVDGSDKEFEDGYTATQRLNFGGKTDGLLNTVEFATGAAATVKLWWVSGGDGRTMAIYDSTGAVIKATDATASVKNALYIDTFELAEAGTYYIGVPEGSNYLFKLEVTMVESAPETPDEPGTSVDPSKIDVWDFGAEQLDTSKYNNMLTVDEINSWYPDATPGSTGINTSNFETSDGQLAFIGGGKTNHRLRTTNESLTCYDRKSLTDANGNVYSGYVYSNSGGNTGVMITIYAQAGDKLTFVHGSNGGAAVVNFEAPSGKVAQADFVPGANSGHAQVTTFYAAETGVYKFYYSSEKLVVARIYREHSVQVPVTGTVTAPAALTGYSLVFTSNESGAVTEVPVSGATYSTQLLAGYSYAVSLKDANGYVINTGKELTIASGAESATLDVDIIAVDLVTVTGNITGLDADVLAAMQLSFQSDAIYVPELTIDGTAYSVQFEKGVTYTVVVEGINDYELTSAASVSYDADATADITFEAKPTYAITIDPQGATLADLAGATFTFTNLNEEGYVYEFVGTDAIVLRDGTYSVKVTNSGIFVQQLTSNLKVEGAAATKTIPFSSDISVWDFRVDDFTGQTPYNGLDITGSFKKHGSQYGMSIKTGTVVVPVSGPCEIKVSVGYNWDIAFDGSTERFTDNTDSGDIDISYSYSGGAGTVTIDVGSSFTSYIKKIEIIKSVPFKSTVTVGASGCDYTTIGEALDAVRAMTRPNGERVTIEIQPGNYEEQLVIDVPNVTLKNASSNPSIELTNKGVDIAANAVRITHYYGCGYNYFSMDSNCKYDENVLAVNKENGYTDFVNPGDGTTNDSYWNATVIVKANGFQAEGIIFENSFNQYVSEKAANDVIVPNTECKEGSVTRGDLPVGSTAVQDKKYVERAAALAIANNCKEIVFDNCKFVGRQDTLYGGSGATVAFYDCSIYGACDYIFGGMTAVFAKCDLVFNTSEDSNDVGYITAPQTPSGSHGYLMYNCNVTSTVPGVDTASEYTSKPGYFGRPWAASTGEAVFYMTVVDAADTHWYSVSPSLIREGAWLNTLSGESALCGEYGTYEYAKDVDNSTKRASWAAVFETETLASGEPISVETWFGSWNPFEGKDMTVEIPNEKVDNKPVEDEPDEPVVPDGPSASVTYVLDSTTDLAAMAAGEKADGDMEKAGTDGYFTIYYSSKTKVDASAKVFEDAYEGAQRLNFGGKTQIGETTKNAVQITTENKATVKIWFVQGGDDNRQVAIFDAEGNQIAVTNLEGMAKNSPYMAELEIPEAGTYFIGNPVNNNNFYKIEVTEEVPVATTTKEYTLDSTTDLAAMAAGDKADGDVEKAGTNDYFTIYYSSKTKVDASAKVFEDAYEGAQRLNFGGKTQIGETTKNAIQITTEGKATVKIWFVQGGDDNRQVAIFDAEGNQIAVTALEGMAKNSPYMAELEIPEAGTYFIGNPVNNNNFYKITVIEEVAAAAAKDYILDSTTDLAAMAAGDKADGDIEKAGTEDFFTIYYSSKTKVDASAKVFDDAYEGAQRLNFGGKTQIGETTKNAIQITVENKATVKIWFVQGGDDNRQVAIFDAEGNQIAVSALEGMAKNSPYMTELEIPEAGTYFIGNPVNNNNFYKIQVTVAGSGVAPKPERADWDTVAAPEITGATTDDGDVKVTVSANVGYDGADEVVVTMYDAEGNEIASKRSIAEKGEHTLTFTPATSGTYTFKATISREGEEAKTAATDFAYNYVLPLEAPVISSATSVGAGGVEVIWNEALEAESYNVYVDGVLAGNTSDLKYTVTGLTVGTKYSFTVEAVRGEDKAMSEAVAATATENAQRVWSTTIYGPSTNTANNGVVGDMNQDGVVTVYSEAGRGKLQYKDSDGITYYYTAIPEDKNFTFRVKVHVDSWTYSNGQEGFGIMATDRVAPNGAATWWSNQYMAMLSKVEYKYDHNTGEIFHTDVAADVGVKYDLRLGLGTTAKLGITPENLPLLEKNDSATIISVANGVTYPLDIAIAQENVNGKYNTVGNNVDPSKLDTAGYATIAETTDFILEIQRNNTGYFITYYDEAGNIIGQQKNFDPMALSHLDTENVYVGFFAARNARATFTIEELSTIDPADDAPAEEKPVTYVTPSVSMVSPALSTSEDYTLSLQINVNGKINIRLNDNVVATDMPVEANVRFDLPVVLDREGNDHYNRFYVDFVPDPDQVLGENIKLSNTDPIGEYFKVTYNTRFAKQDVIYVAAKYGHPSNFGTKESPLDLETALKNVKAGQTIILMEGTYKLEKTMTIENSINGTADAPIRMIADPDAKTRPVLDFRSIGGGLVASGDYWYFQGFDVTNSLNGKPGFLLSGSNCVIEEVNAYHNGNSGIQLSRAKGSDLPSEWPSNNLILNCTSYGNADAGYEDADGFAAKLTCGPGNVFDGCVAHHNADDGWDLYAKVDTGPIGEVTIRNCVSYSNGYLEDGTNAGNGNGFKMGGSNMPGAHKLINSYAFFNKAKGIDSNSGPNIIVENCTTYNNESYNVAFYTNINQDTDFQATGIISFKDDTVKSGLDIFDNLKPRGNQDTSKYMGETNYYWLENGSANTAGQTVTADDFVSTEFLGVLRNEDGTINLQGFLEKKADSDIPGGAVPGGTPSGDPDEPADPDVPGETTPGETTPEATTPGETTPEGTTPGETTPEDPSNPGTGDSFNATMWIVLMLVAAFGLILMALGLRKRKA